MSKDIRDFIRSKLRDNLEADPSYESAMLYQGAILLMAGQPGMPLPEQFDRYRKLLLLFKLLRPAPYSADFVGGEGLTDAEREVAKAALDQFDALDPNPDVDLDQLEDDFNKLFEEENNKDK